MEHLKPILIPMAITYILIGIVAVIKTPIKTLLTPALPKSIADKYSYEFNDSQLQSFEYGLVTAVSDGDTIEVNDKDKIRFLGMDTPELEHRESNIKLECFAKDAEVRMRQLALGKIAYLVKESRDKDKYGRLLRYVFVPSEENENELILLNAYMLGEGYARLYILENDLRYKDDFISFQQSAINKKSGLWGSCDREKFRW